MDIVSVLLDVVPGFVAGGIGGLLVRRVKVRIPMPIPAVEKNHPHDWHIEGKVEGRVRQYCIHCTAHKWGDELG